VVTQEITRHEADEASTWKHLSRKRADPLERVQHPPNVEDRRVEKHLARLSGLMVVQEGRHRSKDVMGATPLAL
jgi:hypothetical protein